MDVVEKVVAGDVRTAARLIREIENGNPEIRKTLRDLHAHTGRAYVVGITGAPGVGKSTLVDQMIYHLRKNQKTVGVVAVDPTSPFSGGALLGDRVRMQRHSLDKGVFIRSLATRGHFGGLSLSTRSTITVMDAMGKDTILVETVGVGQGEIDIAKSAHTTVVVVIPGMGDQVQAVKAGILEAGNIFLVNKSDRPGAGQTVQDLKLMIDLNQKRFAAQNWKPPVLMSEAACNKGVVELLQEIENHRRHVQSMPAELRHKNQRDRAALELRAMITDRLVESVLRQLTPNQAFESAIDAILDGTQDPFSACDALLSAMLSVQAHSKNR
jgi:LAO/AO transport system kinase